MSKPASINLNEIDSIVVRQYKRNDKLIYKRILCWDYRSQDYVPERVLVENASCYALVYEKTVSQAEFIKILKSWSKNKYRCNLATSLNNALKEKISGEYILTADLQGKAWSDKHSILVHTIKEYVYKGYQRSFWANGAKRKSRKRAHSLYAGENLKGSKVSPARHKENYKNYLE